MLTVQVFVYLQLLDFLTTMVGFRLGAAEVSPFVRALLTAGPALGVAFSKGIALMLAAYCMWRKKQRVIGWINYWYAGLVVWNLCVSFALFLTWLVNSAAAATSRIPTRPRHLPT